MAQKIGITAWGSCSALGLEPSAIWRAYAAVEQTAIRRHTEPDVWTASLNTAAEQALNQLRNSSKNYQRLDRSVLLAILSAESAMRQAGWEDTAGVGLLLGSSRGATGVWEQYHQQFQNEERLSPQVSPLTTAGNLASQTAQHLGLSGLATDSSITCSTALHALVNAVAWIESGRTKRFLAGGTEAPLTPFTLAQMQALKIYATTTAGPYPCRSLQLDKTYNSMVLGEGSAVFALELATPNALATIEGVGYAQEMTPTLTAVSEEADALQRAMRQALTEAGQPQIDAIVCHAPGTIRGDKSEWQAIRSVFGKNMPSLASNKWKIGHTLGASGGLSLELALLMLQHQTLVPIPYLPQVNNHQPASRTISRVMVNALGFGGNAVSVIVGKG